VVETLALLSGAGTPEPGLRWHEDYPMAETLDALAMTVQAHRETGWSTEVQPLWWAQQIVLTHPTREATVVGDIGFHGPPAVEATPAVHAKPADERRGDEPVELEIGYNVVAALRGRGIATQACRLLLAYAWRHGATLVRAETDPDNHPSQRVLLRAGFTEVGSFRYEIARPACT
jgi:RimJ/RimL family protein N-acetyltransferase